MPMPGKNEFPRLRGTDGLFRLASTMTVPANMTVNAANKFFKYAADELLEGRAALRASYPTRRGRGGGNGWFMRNAYALLKGYVDQGREKLFARIACLDGHRVSDDDLVANPFKVGIRALACDDTIDRRDRHQYGEQFLAAYHAGVEPDMLLAFLSQQGGPQRMIRKRREGKE